MGALTPARRKTKRVHLMDENELIIVRFLVSQLMSCYSVTGSRQRLAKSMNQVMGDIFGVSKFTQRLERGCREERVMVELMEELHLDKVWALCRSKEHYKMLATLVSIDDRIVTIQKKQRKMRNGANGTSTIMPKYKKNEKELKKLLKVYKGCIKTFREVLDIRISRSHSKYGSLIDFAKNWQDHYEYDMYDFDFGSTIFDGIDESMAKFASRNGGTTRPTGRGVFGISEMMRESENLFGDDYDDDYDEDDDDGYDLRYAEDRRPRRSSPEPTLQDIVNGLADEFARRGYVNPVVVPGVPPQQVEEPQPSTGNKVADARLSKMEKSIAMMATAMARITATVETLLPNTDVDDDEGDDEYEDETFIPRGPRRVTRPVAEEGDEGLTMDQIEALRNGESVDGVTIEDEPESGEEAT